MKAVMILPFYFYLWKIKYNKVSITASPKFAKSRVMCACVATCLRGNVPKTRQLFVFMCQPANKRVNVPNSVPMFQPGMPACQKSCQFFNLACQRSKRYTNFLNLLIQNGKGNFCTLLLYNKKFYIILDITVIHTYDTYMYHT